MHSTTTLVLLLLYSDSPRRGRVLVLRGFGDLTPRELACLLAIGATRVEAPEEAAPEGFLGQAAEVRAERLPTGTRCTED